MQQRAHIKNGKRQYMYFSQVAGSRVPCMVPAVPSHHTFQVDFFSFVSDRSVPNAAGLSVPNEQFSLSLSRGV